MKNKLCPIIFTLCFFLFSSCEYKTSENRATYEIFKEYSSQMRQKHKLISIGTGVGGRDILSSMFMHFKAYEKLNLKQSRKLIISCVDDY